jgi:ribosomal peptide maturation radical SAM protein 1
MRIELVSMPFASTLLPSIQLSLLRTMATNVGWEAGVTYANLSLARQIGWQAYETLCAQGTPLLGEWLFSVAAFGADAPSDESYLARSDLDAIETELGLSHAALIDLRHKGIPAFIRDLVKQDKWASCDVVGITSMFEQTCAGIAFARALKAHYPNVITLFGGANFDGEMGIEFFEKLPFIDAVLVGEAEVAFPDLLDALARDDNRPIDGVFARNRPSPKSGRSPTLSVMDNAPVPDYTDYFMQVALQGAPREIGGRRLFLPFESARGCWWGETSHCTFCGLNAMGMAYRSKTPERVLKELDQLSSSYGRHPFFAVDNILDHRYIKNVFANLEERELDYEFWYELKANLSPAQIKSLAKGGLTWAQPGIETLSTNVLKLMRKGSSSLINLRFLKWASYYQIRVAWNVLYGFPGETLEDYDRMQILFDHIQHLPPPDDCGPIRMDRFSPYHNTPQEWGLTNVRPNGLYQTIYPHGIDLNRIAYYFEFDQPERIPAEHFEPLHIRVKQWQESWQDHQPPQLTYVRGASQIRFFDSRFGGVENAFFGPIASEIYPMIGRSHASLGQVLEKLNARGCDVSATRLDQTIDDLAEHKLIWREGDDVFGLGLPSSNRY